MLSAALTGYVTAFSLIMAIGAQNAFVLRHGLMREHVLPLVLFCAISDTILIAAGVAGFGSVTAIYPALPKIMALAGAAFLFGYGALRFHAAWKGTHRLQGEGRSAPLGRTMLAMAAITWLNPHVYLDTLGLIGAVSTRFEPAPQKLAYTLAAVAASFSFFFTLGYGARLLAPVMQSRRAWQILDLGIGLLMWAIAISLLRA
ncbi:LysE/ArgO family amino acid transporter [Actibacterium sp. XHP0104]|uniref:LysE/ArgO family amino acid transporter n=1 Tax=Actibacterium sp. XHP0104 TaxID=2984335 RepID=UPI0021E7633F|nr:LysE/ArgO family amino acid transporter [Actibacterium sp. XHP0104]MCV2881085.1 LysE/ArgO family amino acid transporter [Actibacterium sp. XHP0104]